MSAINWLANTRQLHNKLPMHKTTRLPFIDAMKGVGCIAIVLHHLAIYGPMSEIVAQSAPWLIDGLVTYARLAVQMFFVLAGFLVASQIAPEGQTIEKAPAPLIWKRYKRLITPFLFAVALATLITAVVRPWFVHESLSDAPSLAQLIAHALLLHDILGIQALSAGVWFVAIDFQLFAATVILTALMHRSSDTWRAAFPVLIMLLAALSLLIVNRVSEYENYAPYFFGAYGLGMLSYWSTRPGRALTGLIVISTLGATSLVLEFRNAITVALATAVLISIASQKNWLERWPKPGIMTWLGQRSYSIFLIHYGICIGFNAIWHKLFPAGVLINAIGILAAVLASVASGAVLYRYVESQQGVIGRNAKTGLLVIMVTAALLIEAITW